MNNLLMVILYKVESWANYHGFCSRHRYHYSKYLIVDRTKKGRGIVVFIDQKAIENSSIVYDNGEELTSFMYTVRGWLTDNLQDIQNNVLNKQKEQK